MKPTYRDYQDSLGLLDIVGDLTTTLVTHDPDSESVGHFGSIA